MTFTFFGVGPSGPHTAPTPPNPKGTEMNTNSELKKYKLNMKMFSAMGSYMESTDCIIVGRTNTCEALVRRGYAERKPNGLHRLTDEGKRVYQEIEQARQESYDKRVNRDRRERGMKPVAPTPTREEVSAMLANPVEWVEGVIAGASS